MTGSSTDPALIVFAWGNASRGDDGIGPLLAERLRTLRMPGLVVIEDHQLNIEHVMDFGEMTPLLFIDASIAIDNGFHVEKITASEDGNFSTHAISPQALLNVYRQSTGQALPDAFLLHVAGEQFGLGEELGKAARDAVECTWTFLERCLARAPETWRNSLDLACG